MKELTDAELAILFFSRLQAKGFKLNFNWEAYHTPCPDNPGNLSIELISSEKSSFCNFDFHFDGSFYRVAGFTSGFWQDEVDWNKY